MTVREKTKDTEIFLLLFLAAFAVRLIYIFFFFGSRNLPDPDSREYLNYAVNLLAGNGYTDGHWRAFRPPGYPFFIAGLYSLFGQSLTILKIAQAFISSLIPPVVYLIGLKTADRKTGLTAGLIACFYFGLIQEPARVLSEAVFTFLFIFSAWLLLQTDRNKIYALVSGVSIGLTAFTRPVGLLLVPPACLWLALKFPRKKALKSSLILILGFTAVLSPWWVRNYGIFGKFVPVCLETGFVMRHSHSSQEQLSSLYEFDNLSEAERDKKNFETGVSYFRTKTAPELLNRWTGNFLQFAYPFLPAYDLTYVLILPFWFYGFFLVLKKRRTDAYLLFFMFIYFPVTAFFFGAPRYRHSIAPFAIIFAAIGLVDLFEKSGNKKIFYSAGLIWTVLNAAIFTFSEPIRLVIKRFL